MINKVTIRDFQSHRKTELVFHEGVNVIIGNSDSGKSAILRAMSWAIENKCDDKSFKRIGGGDPSVTLEFDEGIVERKRTKDNIYNLTVGKKTEEFKAFKQAIPSDIVDLMNMSEINIQTQLEAPFLLSQSSGDIAKVLNKTVDLSVIHESISEIRKMSLQNSREIENVNQQIEENKEILEDFKYLDKLEKDVKAYEMLQKEFDSLTKEISSIHRHLKEAERLECEIATFVSVKQAEKDVNNALHLVEESEFFEREIKSIERTLNQAGKAQDRINKNTAILKLEKSVTEALNVNQQCTQLNDAILVIQRYATAQEKLEKRIEELENEYIEIMPDNCPLCGHDMLEVE